MVMQSSSISGLVGGQMAMFSNQQAYAQQISGLYGTGPQTQTAGMQNPFPANVGATAVSGMAGMAGGVVGGASLAGGFMGGAAGWADPFTGVGRTFMAGRAAAGGAGMLGMAGGMAAAAPAAAAYYMGGAAIMGAAQNVGAGAQNVADVGMLAQAHMGPQFGPGARPGGQMGRTQIRQMTSVLEELASDDVMVTMDSLKRLMDKAGQAGMLQGIGDAQQFKTKFGGMVKQMKSMAEAMGTSLEEAAPLFGQMRQMGMWKTTDIMGTTAAMRAAGPAAPQLLSTMQHGAQMAHAMGGRLGAGAAQGREMFMQVQAAQRAGVISPEMLMEFTGGVGGARGQQMMAQRMQGVVGRFGKTQMGRMMMAGLGEFKEGAFTGGIDPRMMERFQAGDISVGELQRTGQQRTRTREAATSFQVRQGAIGQEMMAQGGMSALTQAVTQVAERGAFGQGENVQNMLIQKMTGVDARTAEMIRTFGQEMPRIQERKQRDLERALDQQFEEMDRRMNRSWEGFKDAWGQAQEQFFRPFREFGADVATNLGRRMDRAADAVWGRTKRFGMSSRERQRGLLSGEIGAGGGVGGFTAAQQAGVGDTSISERMRNLGGTGVMDPLGVMSFGAAAMGAGLGTDVEQLQLLGAETRLIGANEEVPEGFVEKGGGLLSMLSGYRQIVQVSNKEEVLSSAVRRSQDRTFKGLGFIGEESGISADMEKAKRGIKTLFTGNPSFLRKYMESTKGKPAKFQKDELMYALKHHDREAYDAMLNISRRSGSQGEDLQELDMMALVFEKADIKGNLRPDWDKEASRATRAQMFTSTEAYDKAISDKVAEAANIAEGVMGGVAAGAQIGGVVGAAIPIPGAGVVGALVGGMLGRLGLIGGAGEEMRTTLEEAIQNEDWGSDLGKYLKGDRSENNRFLQALTEDPKAQDTLAIIDKATGGDDKKMSQIGDKLLGAGELRGGRAWTAHANRVKSRAARSRTALRAGAGRVTGEARADLEELLKVYSSEEFVKGTAAARGKAETLVEKLAEAGGGQVRGIGEVGEVGAFIGRVRGGRARIGGLKGGADIGDIVRATGISEDVMPEEMRESIREMLSDKKLDAGEKERLQTMFTQAVGGAGPGATRGGRAEATGEMAKLMTAYTLANTDFVFAVEAATKGMAEGAVDKVINEGRRVIEAFTGKDPAPSTTSSATGRR